MNIEHDPVGKLIGWKPIELTSKERMDNTTQLTLERRKEILRNYFKGVGYGPENLSDTRRDALVATLWEMGYFPPMFDLAFRLLLSEQRKVRQ